MALMLLWLLLKGVLATTAGGGSIEKSSRLNITSKTITLRYLHYAFSFVHFLAVIAQLGRDISSVSIISRCCPDCNIKELSNLSATAMKNKQTLCTCVSGVFVHLFIAVFVRQDVFGGRKQTMTYNYFFSLEYCPSEINFREIYQHLTF